MKTYNIAKDLLLIRRYFNLSQQALANELHTTRLNVNRWENSYSFPRLIEIENIYSFAYKDNSKLDLNKAKSMLYEENKKKKILLFHGTNNTIVTDPDNKHSKDPNDFGDGFYLGESLNQAATWVCNEDNASIYLFYFDTHKLKCKTFNVDKEWMYAVLYYRGALKGYEITEEIQKIIKEVEEADYLIVPIADNQMYDVLSMFKRGEITDEACIHSLSATNLGSQYVLKSDKSFKYLESVDRLYLCQKEKESYTNAKRIQTNNSEAKAEIARIEYRREGKYFDELFKKS